MTSRSRWPALIAALLLTLVVISRPIGHAAAAQPSLNPNPNVAATALKYEGSYQGECWGFVKRVVREATGEQMSFDYRQAFFDGGAIEVSLADAQVGDVIQFTDDSNTAAWADYPGLHTAIILTRTSENVFTVIDSNSEFDGIVRIREGFAPISQAAMKGLSFHIYRFPGGGTAATAPAAPTVSAPGFGQQQPATVATPNDCLNLRDIADTSGTIIACMPDGTTLALTGDQAQGSGRTWASVVTPYGAGWVAADYLIPVTSASADEPASQSDPR